MNDNSDFQLKKTEQDDFIDLFINKAYCFLISRTNTNRVNRHFCYQIFSWQYHLTKDESKKLLLILREKEYIKSDNKGILLVK